MCYYSNSVTVSSAKVENVVKPPHIPAFEKQRTASVKLRYAFAAALMSPYGKRPDDIYDERVHREHTALIERQQ